MNKDFKNVLQEVILEDASSEYMLEEGFWDKLKARAAGAWEGTKQAAKNLKGYGSDMGHRILHGKNKQKENDDEGEVSDAYNDTKTESWKKSMSLKAAKLGEFITKKCEDLVEEIKSDASDLGIDEDLVKTIEDRAKQIVFSSKSLATSVRRALMSKLEQKEEESEKRRAAKAAKKNK